MAISYTCPGCRSPLTTVEEGRVAICLNKGCGFARERMGFCHACQSYSVSEKTAQCQNQDCRLHKVTRTECTSCGLASRIPFGLGAATICVNPSCSAYPADLVSCPFCALTSMLDSDEGKICLNPECRHGFETFALCFYCTKLTLNTYTRQCYNRDCQFFGRRMKACPSCHSITFFGQRPYEYKCVNKACSLYFLFGTIMGSDPTAVGKPGADSALDGDEAAAFQTMPGTDEVLPKERTQLPPSRNDTTVPAPKPKPMPASREPADTAPIERTSLKPPQKPAPAPAPVPQPKPAPKPLPRPLRVPSEDSLLVVEDVAPQLTEGETIPLIPAAQQTMPLITPGTILPEPRKSAEPPRPLPPAAALTQLPGPAVTPGAGIDRDALTKPKPKLAPKPKPKVAARPTISPTLPTTGIAGVFRYIQENFLVDENGNACPLFLVVGLPGAGKTSYLTMFGQILKKARFYSPNPEITPRMVQFEQPAGEIKDILHKKIRDLVFDFSTEHYEKFIQRRQWPDHTAKMGTDTDTCFLITELLNKDKRLAARIVTLETSGEDYEEILSKLQQIFAGTLSVEALEDNQRVLWEILHAADGLVLLIDAANDRYHPIYERLFQVLVQAKEPQARAAVKELYAKFQTDGGGGFLDGFVKGLFGGEAQKQSDEEFLQSLNDRLKGPEADLDTLSLREFIKRNYRIVEDLHRLLFSARPELAEKAQVARRRVEEYLASGNADDGREQFHKKYFSGFFGLLREHAQAIQAFVGRGKERKDSKWFAFLDALRIGRNLQPNFAIDLGASGNPRHAEYFERLKSLAIVFTKTDMFPAVYPAYEFPMQVGQDWARNIPVLDDYLKLIDGSVRYYNTSATGWSVLTDTLYYPGKETSLTPINVVEPIFDMVLDKRLSDSAWNW